MSKDITAIPYRTPACDDHLDDNDSDECPWCEIDRLKERFERVSGLLASAYTIADREGTSTNWPAFKDRAYEALHDLPQFALMEKNP